MIRIALVFAAAFFHATRRLLQGKKKILRRQQCNGSALKEKNGRMEWNEVDLVQEFTVEGQCSKIKVRSCRITWDSMQVN